MSLLSYTFTKIHIFLFVMFFEAKIVEKLLLSLVFVFFISSSPFSKITLFIGF